MKNIPLFTTCLFLLITLSACSTNPVSVSMSTTRFDNPEVSSKPLKVNLALGHGGRTKLIIEDKHDDYDSSGTNLTGFYRGNITAAKGLEISVRGDEDSAAHVGIKYQFYGAHTEQSTKGNLSQALTLGYERNSTKEQHSSGGYYSDCDGYYCDYVTERGSWQHDADIYDVAWVVGYKITSRDIIYGGPFYQWGELNGDKNITNTTTNATTKQLKSDGYMIGTNFAIEHRFSFGMGLAAEVVYSTIKWEKYSQSSGSFNFKIDYQF